MKTKKEIEIENLQLEHDVQSKKIPLKRGDIVKVIVYGYDIPFKGLGLKVKILSCQNKKNNFNEKFDSASIDYKNLFTKKELSQIKKNQTTKSKSKSKSKIQNRFPEIAIMKKQFPIKSVIMAKIKKVSSWKSVSIYSKLNVDIETITYHYKLSKI